MMKPVWGISPVHSIRNSLPPLLPDSQNINNSTKMARSPLPLGGGGIASDTFIYSLDNYAICNK